MKTRKGEEMNMGASNFVRSDYLEMRLLKIEERLDRLEKIVESIVRPPMGPRTIQ
ncbi:hypothetical protein KJ780_02325 [Candidatus Micrarchaeota archaeon]|nr:hypothetical protein [Candidatus Micrarchaeota archaeon]